MQGLDKHLLSVVVLGFEELSKNDANLAFMYAGISHEALHVDANVHAAKNCSSRLILQLHLPLATPKNKQSCFEMADRGGLSVLSEYSFAMTALAVQSYAAITFDEGLKHKIMSASRQPAVFVAGVKNIVVESTHY